jgi:hypothetical protein
MVTLDTSVLVDLFLPVEEGRKVKRTMNVYAQQKKSLFIPLLCNWPLK